MILLLNYKKNNSNCLTYMRMYNTRIELSTLIVSVAHAPGDLLKKNKNPR